MANIQFSQKCNMKKLHCGCGNITIKPNDFSKGKIKLGFRSINVADLSNVVVEQPSVSKFYMTCLICQDSFHIRSYENHAYLQIATAQLREFEPSKKTRRQTSLSEKKTMKLHIPLELRKFCTYENKLNYSYSTFNDFMYSENELYNFGCETEISLSEFSEDTYNPLLSFEGNSVIGEYMSSPVLNWNSSSLF